MREKIDICGVPETMLQTLYARAKASQADPYYIYDAKAIEIVSHRIWIMIFHLRIKIMQ